MPPRKRATPAAAPADLAAKQSAIQVLRDEVAAEPEGAIEYFAVPFAGTVVRVKDFMDWPAYANDLLAVGRFTQAIGQIIHPADFTTVWAETNPTNRQVIDFIREVEKVVGIPLLTLLTSLSS
jgi:hypothetical protein